MTQEKQSRDSIRFGGEVNPGSTETQTKKVEEPATVEEVAVRFYQGPRLDLHVKPFIERAQDPDRRDRIPLVDYGAEKKYIDGDNDYWIFPVSESVEREELIGVEVENVDGTNAYDYAVDITTDQAGGTQRVASLFEGIADKLRRLV